VKECVKTRSSAQIRSHAQKYIIKLCKKFNIQDNKNLKSFKNIKRKLPSELIDDADWEKALEWNGEENMQNTNLNMEEIEEIILGIFKTNLSKSVNRSPKQEQREIVQQTNDEKKIKVFETIKEPKNSMKKRQHRIHLQNQMKKASLPINNAINNNPNNNMSNNNIMNYNFMNQLGLTDPHLQMILGNNMLPNGLNLNLGNFGLNMGKNNNNFGNHIGWEQLMTGINIGFPGPIPSTPSNKEDMMNKNNMIDNSLLGYMMNSNPNFMDVNNEEILRNILKANNGVNIGNMMAGHGNPTSLMGNDPQAMDNMNMFNDLMMNLFSPTMNNRGAMPLNEMMMQMYANAQGGDSSSNNNKTVNSNNNMNSSNNIRDNTNLLGNLLTSSNNINTSSSEKNNECTPSNKNNQLVNSGNTLNAASDVKNIFANTVEEISDNHDMSKFQSINNQLANAMKIFTNNGNANNSDLISNIPELFNNNIANLQVPGNAHGLETNQFVPSSSNPKEGNKEANMSIKTENIENINSINPSKPNENILTDDVSMMLLNFLNSSNPQLPQGYDLNSFSQLFDLQNMNNAASQNNMNNSLNCGNSVKKHDSASNLEVMPDDKEKDESIQNKTQISGNQNINNNMSFNNGVNMINNNLLNNNFIGANLDFNINPNMFQQPNLNNFIGDPILGLMNQFFIQPNNMMSTANTNNLPLFNSKTQIDNYFLNNFNPMDMYFDQNFINQNINLNPANVKNNSEK
jgi:hypothetical protein